LRSSPERGVSPIVGAVLVIGIFTGLAVTLYSAYSRAASRGEEGETLDSLLSSLLQARERMEALENGSNFILPFKLNAGGRAAGTLWVKPGNPGRMGFTSRGMEAGDLTLVLEDGALIRLSGGSSDLLSPPSLVGVSEVRENGQPRWVRVDVHHLVVENAEFQLASTSPVSLRFTCTSDSYTVVPENGRPNRENVTLSLQGLVSPEDSGAWGEYLTYLVSVLPPYYGVSADPATLTLTVLGFQGPGVKDILYYERWTRIRVEVA